MLPELQQLPPVVVYEPTYVERPPEVDTNGSVSIEKFDDTWVVEAPWLQQLIACDQLWGFRVPQLV